MAKIGDIDLDVGRRTSGVEFARVSLEVLWTNREVQENYKYLLTGYLLEVDSRLDFYDANPDGSIHWKPVDGADDYVGTIGQKWVRPNGATRRLYVLEDSWNFGNQESGDEEYRSIATIVPETRGDLRLSSLVKANLG